MMKEYDDYEQRVYEESGSEYQPSEDSERIRKDKELTSGKYYDERTQKEFTEG
jgi:hypothetical protein